jgi:hypothetical protein
MFTFWAWLRARGNVFGKCLAQLQRAFPSCGQAPPSMWAVPQPALQAGRQGQARKLHSDLDAGIRTPASRYTVGQAVEDWLREGLDGRSERVIRHPEANDYVRRSVAALVKPPTGQPGRPSRSLTLEQAASLPAAAGTSPLGAYVVLCLLTGSGRGKPGDLWQDRGLVFCTSTRSPLDAANVRRTFRKITKAAGHSSSRTTEVVYRR